MNQVLEAAGTLDWRAWATMATIGTMLGVLVTDRVRPIVAIPGTLLMLVAIGVIDARTAFTGFSNEAVLTIGALYVVVAGVQQSHALGFLDRALFSRSERMDVVVVRLGATTAAMSAFMNNTPLVALLIPRIQGWARQRDIPASKLLIPVSFATVLGGTITIIGTSTNLLVAGWMESSGLKPIDSASLARVGVPVTLAGLAYLATIGHRLLPHRESRPDLVTDVDDESPSTGGNYLKGKLALAILAVMATVSALGLCSIMCAAIAAAIAMVATGCVSESKVLEAIDLPILIVLAATLGIGQAIEQTGLARVGAHLVVGLTAHMGPVAVLAAIYLSTNVLTELISNNAAALLMLPTAIATAAEIGLPPEAFAVTVAVAASAGFMTPIGYQTHMMVVSPGGYRFSDFMKVGSPLNLIVMVVAVTVITLIWS